jgi:hypothetical protein
MLPSWKARTTEARDNRRGIPQGSPILTISGESVHAPVRAGMKDGSDIEANPLELG